MSEVSLLDIALVAITLMSITLIGHLLAGHAKTSQSFFSADGGLPWWAVGASLYATVVSAVSFISVPTSVLQDGGSLTYAQMIIGFGIGKVIMAYMFVRPYYRSLSIDTVYDYLTVRIGKSVSTLAMALQIVMLIIANSVVVLGAALVLDVITGLPLELCAVIIVGFSALWSWMGGLKTVVWTDLLLLIIFLAGAIVSAYLAFTAPNLPVSEMIARLDDQAKLKLIEFSLDPAITYTVWTALLCAPIYGLTAISSQAGMQRIRACRSEKDARRAFIYSFVFYITPLLLLVVGVGLQIFYDTVELPVEVRSELTARPDRMFPYFIVTQIPEGLSGLLIAAMFAAAISTLDSRLTELADISVNNIYRRYFKAHALERHYLRAAKLFVLAWGAVFVLTSIVMSYMTSINLLELTYQVVNTFVGPVIGMFLLARFGLGTQIGVFVGLALSLTVTVALNISGVSSFWWLLVSTSIMVSVGWVISRAKVDRHGIVSQDFNEIG